MPRRLLSNLVRMGSTLAIRPSSNSSTIGFALRARKALSFTIDCPSERFVLFGCCSLLPEKSKRNTRFPIHHGTKDVVTTALLRDFQGRISRFRQLRLGTTDVFYAILIDTLELLLMQFPFKTILKAWRTNPTKDKYFIDGCKALNFLKPWS